MLSDSILRSHLPVQGLGDPFYFTPVIGSTNQRAAELAAAGCPHGTLVVADEQTAGRGRGAKRWWTTAGSGLALSLVLRPISLAPPEARALTALGTMAVVEAFEGLGVEAMIKWPNDVLVDERKVAGILVETSWLGEEVDHVVLGIGINVRPETVPQDVPLDYPATYLEAAVGDRVSRAPLLRSVLEGVARWWPELSGDAFREAWERRLAFRGEQVEVEVAGRIVPGKLLGLTPDGMLLLEGLQGKGIEVNEAGSQLRPVDIGHE
ncbi:MAG: biotin--[acetyl-CoA-carboxylase] ligase [Anaerolineales bacterium]|jgi:BirA family biotin operon repressor/biotin-[acetyl-CoA-carboxylase] ligase